VAAERRNGVFGVEQIMRGRARTGRARGQAAVRVQVVGRRNRARQWPFALVAPVAADKNPALGRSVRVAVSHDEDADGRLTVDTVVNSLQPAVEPAPMEGLEIERPVRPELRLARVAVRLATVRPRPYDQTDRPLFALRERDGI